MKIDLHTHILPETWPDLVERYGYPGWVRLDHDGPGADGRCRARMMIGDGLFREVEDNLWSPPRRLEDCARTGVDVQVLSTVPVMFSYWAKAAHKLDLARFLNDHIAGVVDDHPGRFLGLGTIPMQDTPLAIRELERCVLPPARGGLGFPGVQIGTNVNAQNLNEPQFFPIFEAAENLGAAVFVHPWDMLGKDRLSKYWLPWLVGMPAETCAAICSLIFGGVFERLPRLRVCFSHGGGSFPGTLGRIDHGFHARPDLCAIDNDVSPRDYLARPTGRTNPDGTPEMSPARFYVDSLVHDADALRLLLRVFTAQRVVLGSDYPFPLGEAEPGKLIESMADLSTETKERLFVATAADFLGIAALDQSWSSPSRAQGTPT
jgi:aminocarboxymuconate-semialdehyde decarboxylase